jgi:hypothetical protein
VLTKTQRTNINNFLATSVDRVVHNGKKQDEEQRKKEIK